MKRTSWLCGSTAVVGLALLIFVSDAPVKAGQSVPPVPLDNDDIGGLVSEAGKRLV